MTVPAQRLSASQAYRQSAEAPAFEAVHDFPLDAEQWGTLSTGGGNVSHSANLAGHVLAVTTASGDRICLRSHARPRASAGRSRTAVIACHCGSVGKANQSKRWGLFDDNSGYFFQLDGEDLSVVRRTKVSGSVVDNEIAFAQWSGNKTPVDVTKTHLFEVREVWPNGDAVFFIDGAAVHQIDTDGSIVGPAFNTARLPVSVEIVNDAASTADSLTVMAAGISVEGAANGKTFDAEAVNAAVGAALIPLLSLRVAAAVSGQLNLGELVTQSFTAICSDDARLRWVLNGTLTSASWAAHSNAASFAEIDTTASAITGGRDFGYITEGGLSASELAASIPPLRIQADGVTRDVLSLCAQRIGGSNISVRVDASWKEIR